MVALNGAYSEVTSRDDIVQSAKIDLLPTSQLEANLAMRKEISRTFNSDTFTVPTPEMQAYAAAASLGDDVYGADTTTKVLEAHVAKLTGKDAALFMPTGTMSNQIAMRTHLKQPPYTVLLDHRAHIYANEAGALAILNGAQAIPVSPSNGHHLTLEDIQEKAILDDDIHYAPTTVVALENTLWGTIFPQDEIKRISAWTKENGLSLHLDGARIWHVAHETGIPLRELLEPFDSVSLCFSKGLGAPIGSMLVGSAEFIKKARHFRKMFGGGMRQIGFAAAAAGYALNEVFPLLGKTHILAKRIEKGLRDIGANILIAAETNMVFYGEFPVLFAAGSDNRRLTIGLDLTNQGVSYAEIKEKLASLPEPIHQNGSRVVVHFQADPQAVETFIETLRQLVDEKRASGFVPSSKVAASRTVSSGYGKA